MNQYFLEIYLQLTNESIIQWGGFAIIIVLVYVETASMIGLVVPGGETLLFAAGLLSGTKSLHVGIEIMIPVLIVTAILGDLTGYFIGKKWGDKIYDKKDTWYFKKKYLRKAEEFYKKHNKSSLIIGRFIPMIRTFNPAFSGTMHMPLNIFLRYVIVGIILYVVSLISLGFFLGRALPELVDYLKFVLPAIFLLAILPLVIKFIKEKRNKTY